MVDLKEGLPPLDVLLNQHEHATPQTQQPAQKDWSAHIALVSTKPRITQAIHALNPSAKPFEAYVDETRSWIETDAGGLFRQSKGYWEHYNCTGRQYHEIIAPLLKEIDLQFPGIELALCVLENAEWFVADR